MVVGPKRQQKRFTVSRAALSKSSGVLKEQCEKEWGAKEAKVIKLEDVDISVFSRYLEWLYTGEIPSEEDDDAEGRDVGNNLGDNDLSDEEFARAMRNEDSKDFDRLLPLAFFAHDYADVTFMNAVVSDMIYIVYHNIYLPSPGQVSAVYSRLPRGSPMRKVLVNQYCHCGKPSQMQDSLLDFPSEFFFEMWAATYAQGLARKVPKPQPAWNCHYHTHNGDVPRIEGCHGGGRASAHAT